MGPSDAIASIESALRLAIQSVLGDSWKTSPGAPDIGRLTRRKEEEDKRRDATAVSSNLLEYTMTPDLAEMITRNWGQFLSIFDDKKRFEVETKTTVDLRNAIAHGRDLVTFERDLIAGIAGHIRNQVSLHRGKVDESSVYYPRIEKAVDHRGVELSYKAAGGRLNLGDEVVIRASAFNSGTKNLEWSLVQHHAQSFPYIAHQVRTRQDTASAVGEEVELRFVVTEEMVTENLYVEIFLTTADRKHHRFEGWDDSTMIIYAVNPPLD